MLAFICGNGSTPEESHPNEQVLSMTERIFDIWCNDHKISAEDKAVLKLAIQKSDVVAVPGSPKELFVAGHCAKGEENIHWCPRHFFTKM